MPLVPFKDVMAEAERGRYAVGYFESWDVDSLLAVANAAEAMRSPVILGFSGIYVPQLTGVVKDPISLYATLGLEVCRRLPVPACLLFNESPYFDSVLEAIDSGFNFVMFTEENLGFEEQLQRVRQIVEKAHRVSVAVEGEVTTLPGVGEYLSTLPEDLHVTDPVLARTFVERTGVDALAVNVGQAHLHGRREVHLNLSRLVELKEVIPVPLVLHGASSIRRADLVEAIRLGVRKINVGSVLRQSCFEAIRRACAETGDDYNPYEVVGSGLDNDVIAAGRVALQRTVEDMMRLFGSADKA